MSRPAIAHTQDSTVARTIRFPAALREKITTDAERCGRSFDGQVIALLRRHYGEDVDIAPSPTEILALATASLADVPAAELRSLTRRLEEPES
jgi:molybdopterin converting factor small subunit